MTRASRDLFSSTPSLKCDAVPDELPSKFTKSEKPYIWSWLYDANVKLN